MKESKTCPLRQWVDMAGDAEIGPRYGTMYPLNKTQPKYKESILVGDMYKIYAKFYTGYQDMFRTGNFVQIFYTWKIGLGQSFVGNFAYFLASPFSLIVLLLSVK